MQHSKFSPFLLTMCIFNSRQYRPQTPKKYTNQNWLTPNKRQEYALYFEVSLTIIWVSSLVPLDASGMRQGWITWLPGASWSRGTEGERRPLWRKMDISLSTQIITSNKNTNRLKKNGWYEKTSTSFYYYCSTNINDDKKFPCFNHKNLASEAVSRRYKGLAEAEQSQCSSSY